MDAPNPETLLGLRDRAILSVGLQVGFRRAEIANLKVIDLHENLEYDSLRVTRKGGKKGSLAIHQRGRPSASGRMWRKPGIKMISMGHSFGRSKATGKGRTNAGTFIRMSLTVSCASTRKRSV